MYAGDPTADRGGRIARLDNETQGIINALAEEAGDEPLRLLAVDSLNRPDVPGYTSDIHVEFVAEVLAGLARTAQRQAEELAALAELVAEQQRRIGDLEGRLADLEAG